MCRTVTREPIIRNRHLQQITIVVIDITGINHTNNVNLGQQAPPPTPSHHQGQSTTSSQQQVQSPTHTGGPPS